MDVNTNDQPARKDSRRNMGFGMLIGAILGALVGWILDDILWGVFFGFLLGGAVGSRGYDRMNLMKYPRNIVRRLIISAVLYFSVLLIVLAIMQDKPARNLSILLAVAPSIPGLFFVFTIGTAIASLDELQRRIQVEAIAIGFAITAIITLSYGLLGMVDVPQPNLLYVSLIMVVSWGIGKLWTMWKYR
jgi:glycerol uptake facilitator-like aquaporin